MPAPIRMTRAKVIRLGPIQATGHDTDQATGHWPQSTFQVTSWLSRFIRANASASVATSPPASSQQPAGQQPPAEERQQPGGLAGVDAVAGGGAGQSHRKVERAVRLPGTSGRSAQYVPC
jgi:hypothetical protein